MSVLLTLLAAFAGVGGVVSALGRLWLPQAAPRFGWAFGLWLGGVTMAGTTFAQSMEALPFTLLAAALVGLPPFAAGWWAVIVLARAWQRRAAPAGRQDGGA